MNTSSPLKCLSLLLLACLATKGLQAQALVLCLESDGGVELELAEGTRCVDRVEHKPGEAPSKAFDDCDSESDHCAECADFAVPLIHLKTGRVETADLGAPQIASAFLIPAHPAPASPLILNDAAPDSASSPPRMTSASIRSTVLLI